MMIESPVPSSSGRQAIEQASAEGGNNCTVRATVDIAKRFRRELASAELLKMHKQKHPHVRVSADTHILIHQHIITINCGTE